VTDARTRELERAAAAGDVQAAARTLVEAVRSGRVARDRLELAAYAGHQPAQLALGQDDLAVEWHRMTVGEPSWVAGHAAELGPWLESFVLGAPGRTYRWTRRDFVEACLGASWEVLRRHEDANGLYWDSSRVHDGAVGAYVVVGRDLEQPHALPERSSATRTRRAIEAAEGTLGLSDSAARQAVVDPFHGAGSHGREVVMTFAFLAFVAVYAGRPMGSWNAAIADVRRLGCNERAALAARERVIRHALGDLATVVGTRSGAR
jgi:hypothetical protein